MAEARKRDFRVHRRTLVPYTGAGARGPLRGQRRVRAPGQGSRWRRADLRTRRTQRVAGRTRRGKRVIASQPIQPRSLPELSGSLVNLGAQPSPCDLPQSTIPLESR